MTVDELYEHITLVMSPEEALKKLLSSSLLSYEKLKFNKGEEIHPLVLIVICATELGWHIAVEKGDKKEEVRGVTIGTEEYLQSVFNYSK